jgi:hypothetical protein
MVTRTVSLLRPASESVVAETEGFEPGLLQHQLDQSDPDPRIHAVRAASKSVRAVPPISSHGSVVGKRWARLRCRPMPSLPQAQPRGYRSSRGPPPSPRTRRRRRERELTRRHRHTPDPPHTVFIMNRRRAYWACAGDGVQYPGWLSAFPTAASGRHPSRGQMGAGFRGRRKVRKPTTLTRTSPVSPAARRPAHRKASGLGSGRLGFGGRLRWVDPRRVEVGSDSCARMRAFGDSSRAVSARDPGVASGAAMVLMKAAVGGEGPPRPAGTARGSCSRHATRRHRPAPRVGFPASPPGCEGVVSLFRRPL